MAVGAIASTLGRLASQGVKQAGQYAAKNPKTALIGGASAAGGLGVGVVGTNVANTAGEAVESVQKTVNNSMLLPILAVGGVVIATALIMRD